MCQVAVAIPDEVLFDKGMTVADAQELARRMTALGLYARRNVSLGHCASIAGMAKADFMRLLGSFGVSAFHYDDEGEFDEELADA